MEWWKEGPCTIQRIFRYDNLNRAWIVMIYASSCDEYETITIIAGKEDDKKKVRQSHQILSQQYPTFPKALVL